jgi:hypothetical protein
MSNKKLELIRKKNLSQKEEAFFVISTSPPYGGGVGGEASGKMAGSEAFTPLQEEQPRSRFFLKAGFP